MEIKIDEKAGFCFGVVKAIGAAETVLDRCGHLFCLGDIVHNSAEVERLRLKGLQVIDHAQLDTMSNATVLIRAHGEPPSTYATAHAHNIELIDATCPIVLALQKNIKVGYEEMQQRGGQVVIFGKKGHAEVTGLDGQTNGTAIIVSHCDELDGIDWSKPIRLYSQTTKNRDEYRRLIDNIRSRLPEGADFVAHDTVCNRVANRAKELEAFAQSVDVLLFVAGANSSNGRYLYEHCCKVQPKTHLISSAEEIDSNWLADAKVVGISGGTSTPRWLMEIIKKQLDT
ncbi:MAG: 4-hydroxy-3-methylbut-2-enyl diphosphate reductase [Bacteroidales bacterium]|nr:4-hydroxy-3-methylbut-2-enyl diphosphate reductase [Bacteroidales bacterium]